ncbi:MAG: alpha-L-glutamate ligase-like protein [Pseudomonadota bacterium]
MEWITPRRLKRLGMLGMNCRNVEYISRFNDRRNYPLVDDKLQTKLLAEEYGVAVPNLQHVIRTQREVAAVQARLRLTERFVVKPAHGSGGKGILVIIGRDQETDELIRSNGERITWIDLRRHMSNVVSGLYSLGGRTDQAIVEDLVIADPIFEAVSYEGVPDIRLILFMGYPVMGMLRLATRASDGKANLHQGAIGVGLDIATGRSIAAVQNNRIVTTHPDTNAPLDHLQVPNWERLLHLAAGCYDMTDLGYLGADIVLDRERGPLLLELNARPGLTIQVTNQKGLRPRLAHIESLGRRSAVAEDRVSYAMTHFGHQSNQEQAELFE